MIINDTFFMKKILRLFAGMLMLSAAVISCKKEEMQETLEVTPSSDITFNATRNEARVLTVNTNAASWKVEATEWILTSVKGNSLTVNVKDNVSLKSRSGSLVISAGNAEDVIIGVSQNELTGDEWAISVTPMDPIVFSSSVTEAVLTVETNVAEWTYEVPEWVNAVKDGNTLTLTATDNTTGVDRSGFVDIMAEKAQTVSIPVSQTHESSGDPGLSDGVPGRLSDASGDDPVNIIVTKAQTSTAEIVFTLDEPAAEDVSVEVYVDAEYLAEYNYINSASLYLFPAQNVTFSEDGVITVPAGELSGKIQMTIDGTSGLAMDMSYLIPVCVKAIDNASVTSATKRVNYVYTYQDPKQVKNLYYVAVNDTNPLNALEYVLEDGTQFFDAVVLFAANINYNMAEDRVYLYNNPNVQALLDNTDTYLQPLREKGIKVYLGLLGNHDAAGLCQLSDWGAQEWAREVAMAVREYRLDGVNLDDEYSLSPLENNKWFGIEGAEAGCRLCYELKKAMSEECSWPTEVSIYRMGNLRKLVSVKDLDTGIEYMPGQFVDFWVGDYNRSTSPDDAPGMTMKQCSGMSVECDQETGSITENSAKAIKEAGYGWVMWYAFDPNPESPLYNKDKSCGLSMMQAAARGFYGQELLAPTGYYKKYNSNGAYDSARYTY